MTIENLFGNIVSSYTRAQAIEDGLLVDLSGVDSIKQCWKHPCACTPAVWTIIDRAQRKAGNDFSGICHDISWMALFAIRKSPVTDQVQFQVLIGGKRHTLKIHIGPGDTFDPVITLMLPHED